MKVDLLQGWCGGHGVPESVCTRCNAALIPQFKDAGDWCAEHDLPESQCTVCHPEVKAEWEALAPKKADAELEARPQDAQEAPRAAGPQRSLHPGNDPLCPVEQTPIRFRDNTIAAKAGIQTEPTARRRMAATLEAPAEVNFDRTRVTHITPRTAGVIRELPVSFGNEVQPGSVLAVIESPDLGEAKSRYIELRENHALAKSDHDRVQVIREGTERMLKLVTPATPADEVRRALTEIRVGESKGTLLKAHAALELARSTLEREQWLLESQAGTQKALEAAGTGLAAAEAEFHAARETIAFTGERDRLVAERAVQVARAALESAERKLHVLGLTEEQIAALGNGVPTDLARYELRSPVSGRVIERYVAVGEAVEPKDELLTIADLSTMWLVMDVDERDSPLLRSGQPVLFMADGVPGLSVSGQVTWIDTQVNDRTRTLRVRAELPNEAGLLRAMMFGRARIGLRENEEVLTVPRAAVQTDACCRLVFVRQSEDVFLPRKVVLGTSIGEYVEVVHGLVDGERVATAGSFLLKTEILKGNIGAGCCEVEPGR